MGADGQYQAGPENESAFSDPFLDEVHALKAAASARFGDDLNRIFAHLREIERQNADRLVRPPDHDAERAA